MSANDGSAFRGPVTFSAGPTADAGAITGPVQIPASLMTPPYTVEGVYKAGALDNTYAILGSSGGYRTLLCNGANQVALNEQGGQQGGQYGVIDDGTWHSFSLYNSGSGGLFFSDGNQFTVGEYHFGDPGQTLLAAGLADLTGHDWPGLVGWLSFYSGQRRTGAYTPSLAPPGYDPDLRALYLWKGDLTDSAPALQPAVTGVAVSPPTAIASGTTPIAFSAAVSPSSAGQGVTWSSSPAGVGSVDSSGNYTPAAGGSADVQATITATSTVDPTKSGSATVTIPAASQDGGTEVTLAEVTNLLQTMFPANVLAALAALAAGGSAAANPAAGDLATSWKRFFDDEYSPTIPDSTLASLGTAAAAGVWASSTRTLTAGAVTADQATAIGQIPGLVAAVAALPTTTSGAGLTSQQAAAIAQIPGLVTAVAALPGVGATVLARVVQFGDDATLLAKFAADYDAGNQATALAAAATEFAAANKAAMATAPVGSVAAGVTLATPALTSQQASAIAQIPGLVTSVAALPTTSSGAGLTSQQAAAIAQIPGIATAVTSISTAGAALTSQQSAAVLQIPSLVTTVQALQPVSLDGGSVAAVPAPATTGIAATGVSLVPQAGSYVSQSVLFQTGALQGVRREIATHTFNGVAHSFTFAAPLAVPPAAGDQFVIF